MFQDLLGLLAADRLDGVVGVDHHGQGIPCNQIEPERKLVFLEFGQAMPAAAAKVYGLLADGLDAEGGAAAAPDQRCWLGFLRRDRNINKAEG